MAREFPPAEGHEATPVWALKIRLVTFIVLYTALRGSTTMWLDPVSNWIASGFTRLNKRFDNWIQMGIDARRKKIGELTADSRAEEKHHETDVLTEPEVSHPEIKGEGKGDQVPEPESEAQRSIEIRPPSVDSTSYRQPSVQSILESADRQEGDDTESDEIDFNVETVPLESDIYPDVWEVEDEDAKVEKAEAPISNKG